MGKNLLVSALMRIDAFFDTNVLLYSVSSDVADRRKRERARKLMLGEKYGVSAQVLAEFFVNATRKAVVPMPVSDALDFMREVAMSPVVEVSAELVFSGIALSQRFLISYWDGAIVAAAHALGAKIIYSEDLNHGQNYAGCRVVNPFRELAL